MQRINRALANEGQALKATRRERWQRELGDHFIVDTNLNIVVVQHCELDTLGTELGVLKEFETIALT